MNGFDSLLNCSGTWEGHNRVQPAAGDPINESTSRLIVTPILSNTFIRLDQTWSWKDDPQSGSMLIGYARKSNSASIHWIDTWHNGTRVMPLVGAFDPHGVLIAHGHFPVEGAIDWGWRIEIHENAGRLRIDMHCLSPQGKNDGGVWSQYLRA